MAVRLAVGQFQTITDDMLRFAQQIGATGIQMNSPALHGETRWEEKDVRALVDAADAVGLTFEAIENVPVHFYDKAMLGLPGRDEQIENYQATMRAVARGGVPILGLHFMPNSVWRTERAASGRGGAACTQFDMAVVEAAQDVEALRQYLPTSLGHRSVMPLRGPDEEPITEEMMWDNYAYFLDAVLPVAEEEGLRIAQHPDDPPVPMLGGVARLFYRPEGYIRAWELSKGSPAWGINLCFGSCSQMVGGAENVRRMIEFFGPKGRLFYGHFRDVKGTVPNFTECFIGEGNYDPAEMMALLVANGFDGFLIDDHVPAMDGDSGWNHRGRAHAVGYMQGLLRMHEWMSADQPAAAE